MSEKERFIRYEEFFGGDATRITHTDGEGTSNGYKIKEDSVPTLVIEDYAKYRRYLWCREWKTLDEKQQETIWSVFGKDSLREKIKNEIETLFMPTTLLSKAQHYYRVRGWNKPCTRCGGTGHYSYNLRFGTKCFQCEGRKIQTVIPSKAEVKKFLAKYPEGLKYSEGDELIRGKGEYMKENVERAKAKRESE